MATQTETEDCHRCGGDGEWRGEECERCHGSGVKQ
jgi:DnaJ-class molecular chaperone